MIATISDSILAMLKGLGIDPYVVSSISVSAETREVEITCNKLTAEGTFYVDEDTQDIAQEVKRFNLFTPIKEN